MIFPPPATAAPLNFEYNDIVLEISIKTNSLLSGSKTPTPGERRLTKHEASVW